MKLFEKLRWLPIESPGPGTADVSANSCVLPTLVADTPGMSSARSTKFRPFIGRFLISACVTVPAIWLREVSSTISSPVTVTFVSTPPTASVIGRSNADPSQQRQLARRVLEALKVDGDLVRTDLEVREAKAPVLPRRRLSHDVGVDLTRLDAGARDDAPCGSATRPLTLARLTVSCAAAPRASAT